MDDNFASVEQAGLVDARRASRRKLLLAAQLDSDTVAGPVRIRDLSKTGALLEGAAFPPVGAALVLKRQALRIAGTVAWNSGTRCGVAFESIISVADWVAGVSSGEGGAQGQARVDDIQAAVRAGTTPAATEPVAATSALEDAAPNDGGLGRRIAGELSYVQRLLDDVGDALVEDPVLLRRHPSALQAFDLAGKILGHLGAILAAEDQAAAIDAIGMQELRARLTRERLFGG